MSLRVLVVAFEFRPHLAKGSYNMRPVNNWKFVEQLARFCEVNVMTNSTVQEAVLDELGNGALPNVKMLFIELPKWLERWNTQNPDHPLISYFWEKSALNTALRLHRETAFDAVHNLSSSILWPPLVGVDFPAVFFWGPVCGKVESQEERALTQARGLGLIREGLTFLHKKTGTFNRLRRRCLQKARVIFLENPADLVGFPAEARDKVRFISCGGISRRDMPKKTPQKRTQETFSILTIGGFRDIEGLVLTARAFKIFLQNHPTATLTIVGPKQTDSSLQSLLRQLGIQSSVHWKGWLPQEALLQELLNTDLVVSPDFDGDSASLVAVPALASGVPVVAAQGGGAHLFVDDEWGIKIPWGDPHQIIRELALAMEYILSDPVRRRRMGRAAVRYVKNSLLWEKQGDLLESAYAEELLQNENIHIQVSGNARTFY